jgi:endonuclease IV
VDKGRNKFISSSLSAYITANPAVKTAQIFVSVPSTSQPSIHADEYPQLLLLTAKLDLYVHSCYIAPLWSDKPDVRTKAATIINRELATCAAIGAKGLIIHLRDLATIPDIITQIGQLKIPSPSSVRLYLENMHSTPFSKSYGNPELLTKLIAELTQHIPGSSLGICIDTSHLWACGAPVDDSGFVSSYLDLLHALHKHFGVEVLIHFNDNRYPRGGLKDEHDFIGDGLIWKNGRSDSWRIIAKSGFPLIFERSKVTGHALKDFQRMETI